MPHETPVQPRLGDLLANYLRTQADAQDAGLANFDPDAGVTPYEAGPVQPIDARLAWDETQRVARLLNLDLGTKPAAPASWPQLVAAQEPVVALACALGNFPQMVRSFHVLLHKANLTELRPTAGRPIPVPTLADWARQQTTGSNLLLAVGTLRLAKLFDEAERLLTEHEAAIPPAQHGAWANERAALAWHQGRGEEARSLWARQTSSPAVLFNRGMANLFLGRPADARGPLTEAVQQLPETNGWHHLGRLYLSLAKA